MAKKGLRGNLNTFEKPRVALYVIAHSHRRLPEGEVEVGVQAEEEGVWGVVFRRRLGGLGIF